MKKYTALFMAFLMIVGLFAGGVVYFSVPVYAVNDIYISRSELPLVTAADVATNGVILGTNGSSIIRAGANENGVYPFYYDRSNGDTTVVASLSTGKIYYQDIDGTSRTASISNTFEYESGKSIYYNAIMNSGYSYSIPSSGTSEYNAVFDAVALLYYNGSIKETSRLGGYRNLNGTNVHVKDTVKISSAFTASIYHWTANSNYGYLLRVGSRIYWFTKDSLNLRLTDTRDNTVTDVPLTSYIEIDGTRINYCSYDWNQTNLCIYNFDSFQDAVNNVYYWYTGLQPSDPDPEPDPEPSPDIPSINTTMSYSLMPGYALVLHSSNAMPVLMTAQQKYMSAAFANNNNSWWWQDSRFYNIPSSLPSVGDNYPGLTSSYTLIPWQKQSINNGVEAWHNIFGQTDQAIYATQFNSGYVMIVNPVSNYYDSNIIDGKNRQNGPITVEFDATEAYVYSCAETTVGEKIAVVLTEGFILGGNGATYDSDGTRVNLQAGGSTYVDDTQQATLDKLVSDIGTFFSGTWRHIRQMITSAGKLPSVIVELYSWLPEEYKGVLFSAFGIVSVVAILKVML